MKKLFALILCAVMLLGMIPMAGAAEFKDSKDVSFMAREAVDVMSDLKVITGFPEGTFKPNDTLTRAQAAKILCCCALGVTAADALAAGGTTFSDVPASHWANKFVEYCAAQGIVAGVGDGKFNPDGKLTGYAFGKMLLVALGADGSALTGADWDKNTRTMLVEKHLDYGVTVNNKDLSRQDACRLALNALFNGEGIDPESTLASKSFGVIRASAGSDTKYYRRPMVNYVSSAEGAYWAGTEKKITRSPDYFVKSGAVKGDDLVKALGVTDIAPTQMFAIRNGVQGGIKAEKDFLHEGNTNNYYLSGNGCRLEVYYAADTDKWTFIHLFYFPEKITAVTEASYYSDGSLETPGSVTFENGWTIPSDEFKESDVGSYGLVYGTGKKSMNEILNGVEAFRGTVVSGKLTEYKKKTGLSVDGKAYKFPSFLGKEALAKKYLDNGGAVGDDVKVLLSDDGYAIMVWQ